MYKLGLLSVLDGEDGNNTPPVLASVLMDTVLEAIDSISHVSFEWSLTKFFSLIPQYGDLQAYGDSHRLGLVIGRIMKKRYPQLLEVGLSSVSLDDLLSWPYWPDFIKLYSMIRFYSDCIFTVILMCYRWVLQGKKGIAR